MDPRRLEMLLELSRLGSMRAVADVMRTTTSTVSQQLGVLTQEAGTPLLEPVGRRVRLTPAGHRLADHAAIVLGALEAARADLDPEATPHGTLRVAAFATGVRRSVMPAVRALAADHHDLRLHVLEHEPAEALDLLRADAVDLALTYDYNLATTTFEAVLEAEPRWQTRWGLAVPTARARAGTAIEVFAAFAEDEWIVNSRNTADEQVVRTIGALAGFAPRVTHRADSLDLVEDLIVAGLGVGLLPEDQQTREGVTVLSLDEPEVLLRSYAVIRRGRRSWPPLALAMGLLGD